MNNIGFFDFMSFLLPGGALLALYNFTIGCFKLNFPTITTTSITDLLGLCLSITAAYFLGHCINVIAKKLPLKKYTTFIMLQNMEEKEVELLEANCQKNFGFSIYGDTKFTTKELSEKIAAAFFERVFNLLDTEDKLSKFRILQAQTAFFRNTIVVTILFFIFFTCAILVYGLPEDVLWPVYPAVAIVSAISAVYLHSQRRKLIFTSLFTTYTAWNDSVNASK